MVEAGRIFEHLHSEFFAALEACRVRPQPKSVHQLRTTTRRMEALLNTAKRRRGGNVKFGRKVDKALKALKPIRKAAGPVRDMDVQRGLLADLLKAKGDALPVAERNTFNGEARKLQAKLKKYRKDTATELASVIAAAEDEEFRIISLLKTDLSKLKWMFLLKDAQAIERLSARSLDIGDPDSLHAYRKRSKFSRYLAEMEEQESAPAEQFAKRMKKVLDAIGAWHDWMLLTQLATKTLGKSSALAKILKKERDRALRQAVGAVERLHRQA
jgi:CHAD domain-containing protein